MAPGKVVPIDSVDSGLRAQANFILPIHARKPDFARRFGGSEPLRHIKMLDAVLGNKHLCAELKAQPAGPVPKEFKDAKVENSHDLLVNYRDYLRRQVPIAEPALAAPLSFAAAV
jgi:hypothetical protein